MASQAIYVPPDSPIVHPGGLANEPVGLTFFASSHYIALRLLEGFLPRDQIKVVHVGNPRKRYEAVLSGKITAAVFQEPWISLADKAGWHNLCEGHFLGADIANDDLQQDDFDAMNKALVKAVKLINSDKRRYVVPYLVDEINELPDHPMFPRLTDEDFHLPRLRYIDPRPYPEELFQNTYNWLLSWGLVSKEATWDAVVGNRVNLSTAPTGVS